MTASTTISQATFRKWQSAGESLEPKYGYPSVILLPDDTVVKVWAKKAGFFSSQRWRPNSARFLKHATALQKLGYTVPEILTHGQLEGTKVNLVHYRSIPGKSVRSILHSKPTALDVPALALFYRSLHDDGIDFRGGHFGNIIQTSPGQFGLIDFSSMKLHARPLNAAERQKSLARPLSYESDREALEKAGLPDFQQCYKQAK